MSVLKVHHRTTYRYSRPVGFGEHFWMFRPRDSFEQRLISAEWEVSPSPTKVAWQHDIFGNQIAVLDFNAQGIELIFESNISLEHTEVTGPRFRTTDRARNWPFEYDADTLPDLAAYRHVQYPDAAVVEWATGIAAGVTDTAELLLKLTGAVRETCSYSRRADPGTQRPGHTLSLKRGTCRDFALLMIEAARILGFASRFVTGYIYVPARDAGLVRGGGATHAWVQIFLPGAGWVEYDPTNGIEGTRDLIRVGVARDPRQARPLSGKFEGDRASYLGMDVDVLVSRVAEEATADGNSTILFVG